ncbi:MAG TPA: glycosyltransferase 61 family protein [Bryobacteraceae bacterium]|nr:glycosyltransferase 61 family protein [Bryobacteraceae bacterium]
MTDSLGNSKPAAPGAPSIDAAWQLLPPDIPSLLRPFQAQSAPPRSIVTLDSHHLAVLLRLVTHPDHPPAIFAQEPIHPAGRNSAETPSHTLAGLARQAYDLSGPLPGDDLLLLPAPLLDQMLTPLADDFSFRAVAALLPPSPDPLAAEIARQLRRSLFDRGLVCIGAAQAMGSKALCFLAGDAVRSWQNLDADSRGHVTFTTLTEGGRFANQLFRYAYARLYALRHGLTAAFPEWEGGQLFGLHDPPCAGLSFPRLSFPGFSDEDRQLWDKQDPPIDIDLAGYFQELPECWRKHRPLLRRLFQLPPEPRQALDAWHHQVTGGGRQTLVAIHVRRGDYRILQIKHQPWFRLVPEPWYVDWLRTIWPTLRDPLLFVATDEPETILPVFQEFPMISPSPVPMSPALPDHLRDFEILRRADYLAICNSSYSRMAAILAPSTQKCFLPSFETENFVPYEPWMDPAFWKRFANSWRRTGPRGIRSAPPAPKPSARNAVITSPDTAAIFFDLSDLLLYLLHHATLSGIQRVQCEILRNLPDVSQPLPVRFVVLTKRGRLGAIETSALQSILEDILSGIQSRDKFESELSALLDRAAPCTLHPKDVFLTLGAFWNVKGMGLLLQELKNSGVITGVLVHDILPITASEYFESREIGVFVKAVNEALTFADFLLTTSEYNKESLAEYMASRNLDTLPVHLVSLGHGLSLSAPGKSPMSTVVAEIAAHNYVLCVGTIEARKNPTYLLNIWKMMLRSGRPDVPYLVFVGRKGWLVRDFMDQLKACGYLGGRILLLHSVTDLELDLLYRNCMLTMFPSFVEGWGLPVGESLVHGKVCLCSPIGGVPEVGGELVDYIDPYNVWDGLERLLRYLDDPELLRNREREIAEQFKPRSWRKTTDDLLRSAQALARQVRPVEGVAAITLPPGLYLPITSDAASVLMDGLDGTLSADLSCISGWHAPENSGVRAAQPAAMLRFRTHAAPGTQINLGLRFAAYGHDFRVRIQSGSGDETEVALTGGSESRVSLACRVEPGKLVTAHLSLADPDLDGDPFSSESYWLLKGLTYCAVTRLAGETLRKLEKLEDRNGPPPRPAGPPLPVEPPAAPEIASREGRILLRPAPPVDDSRRAPSFGAFLQSADSYWPSDFTSDRDAPIFADRADRIAFYSGCGNRARAPQVGRIDDGIRMIRRSDQFVSTSRFSEGSLFDRSGVTRAFGYLNTAPPGTPAWLSHEADGLWVTEEALAAAPRYEQSHLIFYNGNLHNYYHWLVEGLLTLDILSRAFGFGSNLKIPLPKSVDINALLDHRETLRAVDLAGYEIVEIGAGLIHVQEAIWVESDLVQSMPAPYLKDFQQRISALYAGLRTLRNRRLLIARKGPTRKIHNLEQVQAFLSRYDFDTVYLEGMSMADQILLFQSADFIVSPHGAGLANLLFCEPGTKVVELMPSVEVRPFFWMISEKLDLVHGVQFCEIVGAEGFQSSIQVDIGKLQALVRMLDAHF